MRPTRLELKGFTAFRQQMEIDFSEMDLFAVSGPTGAGKTSILDALVFALYGQTPRSGGKGLSSLISQGTPRLSVLLEFRCGHDHYRISRTMRRTAASISSDRRLEQLHGDHWEPLADNSADVKKRIKEILGIDFDGFTKSVVLPQGEFDRFLKGDAANRRRILSDLLRLGKYRAMGQRARNRRDVAKARAHDLQIELEKHYADATKENLKVSRKELKDRKKELNELEERRDSLRDVVQPLALTLDELEGKRRELSERGKSAKADLVEVQEQLKSAQDSQKELAAEIGTVDKEIAELGYDADLHLRLRGAAGDLDQLANARDQVTDLTNRIEQTKTDLGRCAAQIKETEKKAATCEKALTEVESHLDMVLKERRGAETALDELRRTHSAAELRKHLEAGADCPVCDQPVVKLPRPATGLESVENAKRDLRERHDAVEQARGAVGVAQSELYQAKSGVETVRQEIGFKTEKLKELTGQRDVANLRVDELQVRLAEWDDPEQLPALLKNQESAKQSHGKLVTKKADLSRKQQAGRDELTALEARRLSLETDLKDRDQQLAEVAIELKKARRQFEENTGNLEVDLDSPRESVAALLRSSEKRLQQLSGEVARLEGSVEALKMRIDQAKEKRKRRKELLTEARWTGKLAQLLRANNFIGFILSGAFDRLSHYGTDHLKQLSSGRYSFSAERGSFNVLDHWNADEPRSVSTLSGGESFLASLALALALAESLDLFVTDRESFSLESLFLDEGFSTLDAETLDVVVQGIETLATGDRMIGVISHLPELAERFPHRIVVSKAIGGSSVEVIS